MVVVVVCVGRGIVCLALYVAARDARLLTAAYAKRSRFHLATGVGRRGRRSGKYTHVGSYRALPFPVIFSLFQEPEKE